MPRFIETDSYQDSQRYRVAARNDGKWGVYDTEQGACVSVHAFQLDAIADAGQRNDAAEEQDQ